MSFNFPVPIDIDLTMSMSATPVVSVSARKSLAVAGRSFNDPCPPLATLCSSCFRDGKELVPTLKPVCIGVSTA